ncbi:MAG: hypothetical protein ACXVIR_10185 [Halobacteriota archaeon]
MASETCDHSDGLPPGVSQTNNGVVPDDLERLIHTLLEPYSASLEDLPKAGELRDAEDKPLFHWHRSGGRFSGSIETGTEFFDEVQDVPFNELPQRIQDAFLQQLETDDAKAHALLRRWGFKKLIDRGAMLVYAAALSLLLRSSNGILQLARSVLDEYHEGEYALKTLLLRGPVLRCRFHSLSALLHLDITGPSRGGKDSLISRLVALLPGGMVEHYASTSAKAPYYQTLVPVYDDEKRPDKVTSYESDPSFYRGKLVIISEVADATGYTAVKALAEEDEYSTRTHLTIVNGYATAFSVHGPRSLIIMSVKGIHDSETREALNRMIQGPISEKDSANERRKVRRSLRNLQRGKDVRTDYRTPILQAAFELLFYGGFFVKFEEPTEEVAELVERIGLELSEHGFNITQIKQMYALAECAAFQKRFYRGNPTVCRVEAEDVLEALYLLNQFARETAAKLIRSELKILDAIEPLTDEELWDLGLDPESIVGADRQPTQQDIVRRTGLSQGAITKALKVREPTGKLITSEFVYMADAMRHEYRVTTYVKTERGRGATNATVAKIECGGKTYFPLDPARGTKGEIEIGRDDPPISPYSPELTLKVRREEGVETFDSAADSDILTDKEYLTTSLTHTPDDSSLSLLTEGVCVRENSEESEARAEATAFFDLIGDQDALNASRDLTSEVRSSEMACAGAIRHAESLKRQKCHLYPDGIRTACVDAIKYRLAFPRKPTSHTDFDNTVLDDVLKKIGADATDHVAREMCRRIYFTVKQDSETAQLIAREIGYK